MDKGRFEYKLLSKYPHMKPADVGVWEKFVKTRKDFFYSVDYDFHVGEGAEFLPTGKKTPEERENRLYQRKIDVVGYKKDETWIIEVKPVADMATLGQILTYRALVAKSKEIKGKIRIVVLCNKIMNEMKDIYSKYNITVVVV